MDNEFDIAIVGMACRFPGANSPGTFWQNLVGGVESISRLTDKEILEAGVAPGVLSRPDYVKAAPVLDNPALFDAAFFGFSAGEASAMDPQQRLLLELAYAALEDAACDPERFRGQIGVFMGSAMNTYFMNTGQSARFAEDYIPTLIVNDKDFIATRISYKLGLRGPSMTVQTACSTSLVATHLARQSLLSGEIDLALVGAVSVRVPHHAGYFYDGSGVVSPDGHVRAFDAQANGTVFGSGAGVIVLKRLASAVADGDHVYAVLKGSAVNNDGAGKVGYTAPSVNGQADAVVEALANAGVNAGDVTYVEAHGSGTPVGDPIEVLALTKGFRNFTQRQGYCAIGSVKTNVGHLDAAAGMAGLIKTVLALKHKRIPPTLHYTRSNPEIDFSATPFFVNTTVLDWPTGTTPRRAGVMSTGMGGTNAYVVLEEPPEAQMAVDSAEAHLLVLSAKTPSALDAMSRNLADFLAATEPGTSQPSTPNLMASVAHTLQTGRKMFPHRRFVVCQQAADAITKLRATDPKAATTGVVPDSVRPAVVFLLPGIGDHYVGMAGGLYKTYEVFRQAVDRCAQILQPLLHIDIRDVIYPRDRVPPAPPKSKGIDLKRMLGKATDEEADSPAQKLDQTIHCQPALFAIEYGLAQIWLSWGVKPDRLVGHSMGEYVAACLAGVFSLDDALKLIAIRAKLVNELPLGAMVAVMLPERELLPLLGEQLSISLINGPNLCVVAGPLAAMADFQNQIKAREIIFRPVRNAHAFHSRMLDPIIAAYAREFSQIPLNPPRIPFISNVTGTWITPEQATDPQYWVEHARRTARFNDAFAELWKLPEAILLEVGPGRTLGTLAMQHPARSAKAARLPISSVRHGYENQPDASFILHALGRLWLAGTEVDWNQLDSQPGWRKIPLPTYPFERLPYWIQAESKLKLPPTSEGGTGLKADVGDWFYVPSWERTGLPAGTLSELGDVGTLWLIIGDPSDVALHLIAALERSDASVVHGVFSDTCRQRSPEVFEIRAGEPDDYVKLVAALKRRSITALNIVHLGALSERVRIPDPAVEDHNQELGFYSLLNLAKAIGDENISFPIRVGVLTCEIHDVTGEETLNPAMATVLGACGVMPKEYENVTSFNLDLPRMSSLVSRWDEVVGQILAEFHGPVVGEVVAYRGRYRWKRSFKPVKLLPPGLNANADLLAKQGLRHRGVYVITGGTGGLGLTIAKYLAETCQARLILTKKTAFPDKAARRQRLAAGDLSASEQRIASALVEIENLGGEVDVFHSDVSDLAGMRQIITATLAKHRAIHGVIHAAGIIQDGLMQTKTTTEANRVLAPKVDGTFALYDTLQSVDLDFLILFSSLASVTAPLGHCDYSAANAVLDAFSPFAKALSRFRVQTINWPAWREVGILADSKAVRGLESWMELALEKAILTKDGLEVFKRVLASKLPQVLVSPESLDSALSHIPATQLTEGGQPALPRVAPQRKNLTEPANEVERAVAEIWCSVLGIVQVGTDERFVDLGGHSLQAMQIVSRIRATYQINFTLRNFFETPTIAQISLTIHRRILAEVEGLSDEEATQLASDN